MPLIEKQKKLPMGLQKAILASSNRTKDDKKNTPQTGRVPRKERDKKKPKMPQKPKSNPKKNKMYN